VSANQEVRPAEIAIAHLENSCGTDLKEEKELVACQSGLPDTTRSRKLRTDNAGEFRQKRILKAKR
jgi:hypothetical protein